MDYRSMFEGKYMGAWNLIDSQGNRREVVLTIARVEAAQIVGEGGKTNKKPLIHFEKAYGVEWLPMVCGKTVAKTVAALYGNNTKDWVTKRITLYGTTTSVGGQEKDCIRVRPTVPQEPPSRGRGPSPQETSNVAS